MFTITAAEFIAEDTANILVSRYIPLGGSPSIRFFDYGQQVCAQLVTAVYKLLGIRKLTTSAFSGNGCVERVNHTMAEMLGMVCTEYEDEWNVHLPYVKYAFNNSVSAATGLVTEVYYRTFLSPFLITHSVVLIKASDCYQLTYCDIACNGQNLFSNLGKTSTRRLLLVLTSVTPLFPISSSTAIN